MRLITNLCHHRWKGDSLQKAMDKSECFYDGCGSIKKQQMTVANQCKVKDFVGESTDGCTYTRRRDTSGESSANFS